MKKPLKLQGRVWLFLVAFLPSVLSSNLNVQAFTLIELRIIELLIIKIENCLVDAIPKVEEANNNYIEASNQAWQDYLDEISAMDFSDPNITKRIAEAQSRREEAINEARAERNRMIAEAREDFFRCVRAW